MLVVGSTQVPPVVDRFPGLSSRDSDKLQSLKKETLVQESTCTIKPESTRKEKRPSRHIVLSEPTSNEHRPKDQRSRQS